VFFGCSNYPDCDFVVWNRPILEKCPSCDAPFLVEKITKRHGRQLLCHNEDCAYSRQEDLPETA
jgi:DNA topoisomerase I